MCGQDYFTNHAHVINALFLLLSFFRMFFLPPPVLSFIYYIYKKCNCIAPGLALFHATSRDDRSLPSPGGEKQPNKK